MAIRIPPKTNQDAIDSTEALKNAGGGSDEPVEVSSADITDATATGRSVLTAADQASARTAIGAGTGNSNLAIGTSATTAAAGNHTHSDYATTAALAALEGRVAALESA